MTERSARHVVIGGGAVGCAVACSLAQAGETDVLVVEKEPYLAAETSSQAAGLVGQVRSTEERVRLAMASVETFSQMQADPDLEPGWRQVGSLRVALTEKRVEEFRELARVAHRAGLEVEFIDEREAQEKWPVMDFGQARAILWCPTDGYLQPSDLTMAYSALGRRLGAEFATNTAVRDIVLENGRVAAVETDRGRIHCEKVIDAAGAHAYHIAKLVGLELPIVPVRHEFLITVEAEGVRPDFPVIRIPDATLYLRADVNALLLGGWEPSAVSLAPREFGLEEKPPTISADWDVLSAFGDELTPLFAGVKDLGVRSVFKGWPTFVPDGRFIIGESCRVPGFVMAGGCNAHGVSGSAGIGRHVVESILQADPSPYVKSLSPDRFTETSWDWETARREAQRVYETYYTIGH